MKPEYVGCTCQGCENYEQEGPQRCEVAESALFFNRDERGKLLDFGEDIKIVVPPDAQACEKFSPSRGWLMMQAEANSARQHQQAVRQHKGHEA